MKKDVCTVGFAQKPLRKFVELLQTGKVTKLVDTRLNNTSQLAGYAKRDDLKFVLDLVGINYSHQLELAPTQDILDDYKKKRISWDDYEKKYLDLLYKRKIEDRIDDVLGDDTICFLCSEHKPHHCHRRLLAEYIKQYRQDINILHLY
jgi:uncharacterized protein (DUF488 family)